MKIENKKESRVIYRALLTYKGILNERLSLYFDSEDNPHIDEINRLKKEIGEVESLLQQVYLQGVKC